MTSSTRPPIEARTSTRSADDTRAALRVLVLGTGAMGSLVSARLARSEQAHVTMAGTWKEALDTISTQGVVVHESDGTWSAKLKAVPLDTLEAQSADVVLVFVKSHQTSTIAPIAARALAHGGLVLTMQNGLGNYDTLAEHAGSERVVLGVTSMGATSLGPGHVANGGPGRTVLGIDATSSRSRHSLVRLFETSGVPIELRGNVDTLVWRKLAVNCAINPLSALLGVPNGKLLEASWTVTTMERAAHEVASVASALDISLDDDPAEAAYEVARNTAGNRSSMLQDVSRGARTEIDAINGAVVRLGQSVSVATPTNEALVDMIQQLDIDMARPVRDLQHTWSAEHLTSVRNRLDGVSAQFHAGAIVNMLEN